MEQNKQEIGKEIIGWKFWEYEKHDRQPIWFVSFFVVFFLLFLYAIFTKAYIFAVFIVMAALLIIKSHHEQPHRLKFSIREKGILVGDKFYNYQDINNFWIVYDPPIKKIYFELNN